MDKEIRVLILEDNPADARLMEIELQATLKLVSTRVDTKEGFLEALKVFKPEVILADYSLPSFDGLTALKLAQELCRDTPFIFVSGNLGEEIAIEALKNGASDYVVKNRLSKLTHSVNRALKEKEEILERKQAEDNLFKVNRALKTIIMSNKALVSLTEEKTLLNEICRIAVEVGGYKMAWAGYVENNKGKTVSVVAGKNCGKELPEGTNLAWQGEDKCCKRAGRVLETGKKVIYKKDESGSLSEHCREKKYAHELLSSISLPLCIEEQIIGMINIYAKENDVLGEEEVELLESLAEDLSYGIKTLRTDRKYKDAQAQLIQSEKLASIGRLSAGVAHEINNPLTSVLMNLAFLKEDVAGNTKITERIDIIDQDATRIKDIVTSMLGFSRKSIGAEKAVRVEANINETIEKTLKHIEQQLKLENIDLVRVLGENLPKVSIIFGQIQQLLLNLFINARDAIRDKRGKEETSNKQQVTSDKVQGTGGQDYISITTRETKPGQVDILVQDSGSGIPVESINTIFEPFYTTKETGKGTGLGLYVALEIIKNHKGSISVANADSVGAVFTVTLPV